MSLVSSLLASVELTPGQLAELRAIDAMYHTRTATDPDASSASSLALDELVLSRVRDMLHDDQRVRFDENRAAQNSVEARSGAHAERSR